MLLGSSDQSIADSCTWLGQPKANTKNPENLKTQPKPIQEFQKSEVFSILGKFLKSCKVSLLQDIGGFLKRFGTWSCMLDLLNISVEPFSFYLMIILPDVIYQVKKI
jgi:hypothetical protein